MSDPHSLHSLDGQIVFPSSGDEIVLDNSGRGCAAACLRKFYLKNLLGLQKAYGSHAKRFGSTFHGFMEGYYGHIKIHGWSSSEDGAVNAAILLGKRTWDKASEGLIFSDDDYRTFSNCCELFLLYIKEFQFDRGILEVVETEQVFRIDLKISDEERILFPHLPETVSFTGKIDLTCRLDGMNWIDEFKSTGQYLPTQISRLNRSPQIMGYSWASEQKFDFPVSGCLVSFAHISSKRKKDGDWGAMTMKIARIPQVFTASDLQIWRTGFLHTANRLMQAWGMNFWPQELDSCYQFGPCEYINLCEQTRPISDLQFNGFVKQHWNVEESELD